MIEYWQSLTQSSQVAIIVASIAGSCSVLAAAIKNYFKLGIKFLALGITGFFGIAGFDFVTFDESVPHVCPETGCERSPLFTKVARGHERGDHHGGHSHANDDDDRPKSKGKKKGNKGKGKGKNSSEENSGR